MTWLAAAWSWFIGTKVGRFIVGIALVIGGLALTLYVAFRKGKHAQADVDKAKTAQADADAAKVAQQTYSDATAAAAQVRADAGRQPPPDPVKRDDLNNTF